MVRADAARTLRVWRAAWRSFVAVLAVLSAAFVVELLVLLVAFDAVATHQASAILGDHTVSGLGWLLLTVELFLPAGVVTAALLVAGINAIAQLSDDVIAGRPTSIRRALRRGVRRTPAALGAGALYLGALFGLAALTPLLVLTGLVGLVLTPGARLLRRSRPGLRWPSVRTLVVLAVPLLPVLVVAVRWALFVPAAALERNRPRAALARSAAAVRGRWVGTLVVVGAAVVACLALESLAYRVGLAVGSANGASLANLVAQLLLAGVPVAAVTVLFRAGFPESDPALAVVDPAPATGNDRAAIRHTALAVAIGLIGAPLAFVTYATTTAAPAAATPTTLTVDSLADDDDATPGDGVCATAASVCTLRAAVSEANAGAVGTTWAIRFAVDGEIDRTAATPLVVTADVDIDGTGHQVRLYGGACSDCPGTGQLFRFTSAGTHFRLANLLLSHGSAPTGTKGGAVETTADGTIEAVTFTSNSAVDGGGAIGVLGGTLTVTNATFDSSAAPAGPDIWSAGATTVTGSTLHWGNNGSMENSGGTFVLRNSIVAVYPESTNDGCVGTFTGGSNITTSSACLGGGAAVTGLGTLGDHGGSVPTFDLALTSNAVDTANAAWCPPTDARGITRPLGAGCDAGAYEATPAPKFVVDDLGDAPDANAAVTPDAVCATATGTCTLRAAIEEANALPAGTVTITFAVDGTITVGSVLAVTGTVGIDGTGHKVVVSGGGAVPVFQFVSGNPYTITQLTIADGTTADPNGGGGIQSATSGTLTDVTFTANHSTAGPGGALSVTAGTVSLTNATFSGNTAPSGGDIASAGTTTVRSSTLAAATGGSIEVLAGSLTLDGSIVKAASGADCTGAVTGTGDVSSDATCPGLPGTDPLLGTLGDHGGSVPTIDLAPASPAIDAGDPATCPATDARGVSRPQLFACDAGAYEVQPSGSTVSLVVDDLGDAGDAAPGDGVCATATASCTLRAAIDEANAGTAAVAPALAPSYAIGFAQPGTISPASPLTVAARVTIDGGANKVVVDGGSAVQLLRFTDVRWPYTLRHLTLAHGASASANGGGALESAAPGTIDAVTFTGNLATAGPGGAVAVVAGHVAIVNTTFSQNAVNPTSLGGADLAVKGTADVTNATFSGSDGGAIEVDYATPTAVVQLLSSTITSVNGLDCAGNVLGAGNVYRQPVGCGSGLAGTDPLYGTFGDHGGVVPVVPLRPDSPAINAAVGGTCPSVDARGLARPQGGGCDAGAAEFNGATSLTVSGSPNPAPVSANVDITATVTNVEGADPTGTVTFSEGATVLGSATVGVGGTATLATASLAAGSHVVTADFSPTGVFASSSGSYTQVIDVPVTAVSASTSSPSTYGQDVAVTVSVGALGVSTYATGTVALQEGGTPIGGSVALVNGAATLTAPTPTLGSHTYTVVYSGDGLYPPANGTVTHVVTPAGTTVSVATSGPTVWGEAATITVTVTGSGTAVAPTGSVDLSEGGTALGSATLDAGGTATFSVGSLDVGTHALTATYAGDGNFTGGTGGINQVVGQAATDVVATSSAEPSVVGQSVALTVAVTATAPGAGLPTGTVTVYEGATVLGTGTLDAAGQAIVTVGALPLGVHGLTVGYGGDTHFLVGGTSTTQTVGRATSTTAVAATPSPSVHGQSVTLVATVAVSAPGAGTPTGNVTFRDGATVLGTATLTGAGTAALVVSSLATGAHTLSADYAGDPDVQASTGSTAHTVGQAASGVVVGSSPSPAVVGQPVTLTATVGVAAPGAGTPTGTVTFTDGATVLGTGTLDGAGQATLTTTVLAVGTRTITATYGGDGDVTGSTGTATQQIDQGATTTALASSAEPSVLGQPVTFTATVAVTAPGAGTPTGTVTFTEGATVLGTGTLGPAGTATFTTSSLAVGVHSVTATYGGDADFAGSASTALTQTVSAAGSTVTVTGSVDPSVVGESVTFTAVVVASPPGPVPTGTVAFSDGATALGSAVVDGTGTATLTTSSLAVGAHTIGAVYSGDANVGAGAGTVGHTVTAAATTTAVVSSGSPSVVGQSVTFTATVSVSAPGSGVPTGTVTFTEGATTLATVPVGPGGQASWSTSGLALGAHTISASYGGSASFGASSGSTGQSVGQAASTTAVVSSGSPSVVGQSVTFTATVSVSAPGSGVATGTVTFTDGATTLGSGTLDGAGKATLTTAGLAVGAHTVTAVYAGDGNVTGSSGSTGQSVGQATTTTGVTGPAASTTFGMPATFTATVAAVAPGSGTPAGTVTFTDGATTVGTATLDGAGQATLTTSALSVGAHSITATYGGAAGFTGSSGVAGHTVLAAATTTSLTSSVNPSVVGQPVTLTATVTPVGTTAVAAGSVTFTDGATVLGTVALDAGGQAALTTSALATGAHSLTAAYTPGAGFNGSSSSPLSQTVNAAGSTVAVTSSTNPSVVGQPVTFTITVTAIPAGPVPTGSVTVTDGGTVLGAAPLSPAGTATFTTSALAVGSRSIVATYGGDGTVGAGASPALGQVVSPAATTTAVATSSTPTVTGQAVTFTATVAAVAPGTGTPAGTVTFTDGATTLGTVPLGPGGTAALTTSSLAVGAHTVTAAYAGSASYAASSGATAASVSPAATTTSVTPSPAAAVTGQAVTFTATVAAVAPGAGTPAGSVTFTDGATVLGTVALGPPGSAALTTSSLTVGAHTVTAAYAGSASYAGSSGTTAATVSPAATTAAVASSANPSLLGQPVTLTVTAAPVAPGAGVPSGTVALADGGSPLATVALDASGTASFTTSALAVGAHPLTAAYSGDAAFAASSGSVTQTVNAALSATTVTGPGAATVAGQPATFTATVVAVPAGPTATGTVTFTDGATTLGTVPLGPAGTAALTTGALAVGNHTVTAAYSGDANLAPSSGTTAHTVTAAATTTAVATSATPTVTGQAVTFTATVAAVAPGAGTPTGTVTFTDGVTILGTGPVGGTGTATLTTAGLAVGPHTVTATYGGDASFTGSAGTVAQAVDPAGTTTALAVSPDPSVYGDVLTLRATVAAAAPGAGTPTGTVTFTDATLGTALGSAPLDAAGTASLPLAAGTLAMYWSHQLVADYGGDAGFGASSGTATPTITAAPTSLTVSTSPPTPTYGTPVTATFQVSSPAPVALSTSVAVTVDGTLVVYAGTLPNGVAQYTLPLLAPGSHTITGDVQQGPGFGPSTASTTITVTPAATTTTLTASPAAVSRFGQAVALTATVGVPAGSPAPTGTVTFRDGAAAIGTAPVSGGKATLTTSAFAVGGHGLTASFTPAVGYLASTSATLAHTVLPAATATTVTVAPSPSVAGQAVTFTATVAPVAPGAGLPTGTVTFTEAGVALGSAPVGAGGTASFTTAALAVGPHTVTAGFGGNASFVASTGSVAHTVGQASATVTLTSSPNPSVIGQPVSVTARVAAAAPGAGLPTGTVTFRDTSTGATFGPVPVDATGTAVGTLTPTVAAPTWGIRLAADYSGDTSFTAASATTTQRVDKGATTIAVTSSPPAPTVGQYVTLTATVTPVAPAAGQVWGSVTFYDYGSVLAGPIAVYGTGTVSTTRLVPDTFGIYNHSITASFSGDWGFNPSTSAALAVPVTRAAPTMALSVDDTTPVVGQGITLTALWQAPVLPTYPVTFVDGSTTIGTAPITWLGYAFGARLDLSGLTVGRHTLTVGYGGDGALTAGSTSLVVDVQPAPTSTLLVGPQSSTPDQPATYAVYVRNTGGFPLIPTTPTGTVDIDINGSRAYTGLRLTEVFPGYATAQFPWTFTTTGTNTITATYVPDPSFVGSSGSLTHVVAAVESWVDLTSSATTAVWGQQVWFYAPVSARWGNSTLAPTGTVTIDDGAGVSCTTVPGGSCALSWPTAGYRTVTASYGGDANFTPATSRGVVVDIRRRPAAITASVSSHQLASGDPVTVTWQMTGPSAATVGVWLGSTPCSIGGPAAGSCTVSLPVSLDGAQIKASVYFPGDALWAPTTWTDDTALTVIGCYRYTANGWPAEGGTVSVTPPPNCNNGTGYLRGTQVFAIATPAAGWEVAPDPVSGQRVTYQVRRIGPGYDNWSSFTFRRTYECVTVTYRASAQGVATAGMVDPVAVNGTSSTFQIEPNCPVDDDNNPIRAQWTSTPQGRSGRFLRGTVLTMRTTLPGNGVDTKLYGYRIDGYQAVLPGTSTPGVYGYGRSWEHALTLDRDRTFEAIFGPTCYTLTTGVVGDGHLDVLDPPNCVDPDGTTGYRYRARPRVRAWSDTGTFPSAWRPGGGAYPGGSFAFGDVPLTSSVTYRYGSAQWEATTEVELIGNGSISGVFTGCKRLDIAVRWDEKGSVVVNPKPNCPTRSGSAYIEGTAVSVEAKPSNWFYRFGGWQGDIKPLSEGFNDRAYFRMDHDRSFTANFYTVGLCRGLTLKVVPDGWASVRMTGAEQDDDQGCPNGPLDGGSTTSEMSGLWGGGYLSVESTPKRGNPQWGITVPKSAEFCGDRTCTWQSWDDQVWGNRTTTYMPWGGTIRATACQEIDDEVTLVSPNGNRRSGQQPDGYDFINVYPAPNCPYNDRAWVVGTKVDVAALAPPQGYQFVGWSGAVSGDRIGTSVTLDGSSPTFKVQATYNVRCFTLSMNRPDRISRSKEPNCPDVAASENKYIGGTTITFTGRTDSDEVFQGWSGDVDRPGKVSVTWVTMDGNRYVQFDKRDKTVGEKISDGFEWFGNQIAIGAKKAMGVIATAVAAVLTGAPPLGIVSALVGAASALDQLLSLAGVNLGITKYLEYAQQTIDFMTAGLTCASQWAFASGSQPNTSDNVGTFLGGQLGDQQLGKLNDSNLRDATRNLDAAEMARVYQVDHTGKITGELTSTADRMKIGYYKVKKFRAEVKASRLGNKAEMAVDTGMLLYDAISGGPGVGWDANAKDAWTNGDAFWKCAENMIPDYLGLPPPGESIVS